MAHVSTDAPGMALTWEELNGLSIGFKTIRDEDPRDDVANWANAVLALLEDDTARHQRAAT